MVSVHTYLLTIHSYTYFSHSMTTAEEAVRIMEDCINYVKKWMLQNKLKLNDDKTEILIITPSCWQTHKCNIASITIVDCNVTKSDCISKLGILFDSTMHMTQHITAVVKCCNIQIQTIGRIHKSLTTEAASNLIHAFISKRLDYMNFLLDGLLDSYIQRVQTVQNTAARILTRTRKYDHSYPILHIISTLAYSEI